MAILKNTTIDDQGFLEIPSGTTAQRPGSPREGMTRYNTTLGFLEEYRNNSWNQISHRILEGSEFAKGKILQTVYGSTTATIETTSTSYQNSNLTATITPQFASSRLVVNVIQTIRNYTSSTGTGRGDTRLRRTRGGSTSTIGSRRFDMRMRASNSSEGYTFTDNWKHSEIATVTTPVTYFTQIRRNTRSIVAANLSNGLAQMVILEIAD
jgi:hypothetical protein